jgi:hypothetical protein
MMPPHFYYPLVVLGLLSLFVILHALNVSLFRARKNWLKSSASPPCFGANLVKLEELLRRLRVLRSINFGPLHTLIN